MSFQQVHMRHSASTQSEWYPQSMDSGFHHLHTRKRIYQKLESYPSTSNTRRLFDTLMYAVALFAPLALVPQVIHIYTEKTTAGLVPYTWMIFIVGHILWIIYGTLHREVPLIISHAAVMCLNIAILVGIYLY
jgi:uncharacterized protein with PQ loop repeat